MRESGLRKSMARKRPPMVRRQLDQGAETGLEVEKASRGAVGASEKRQSWWEGGKDS
jgi:hypothetical protein